MTEITSMVRYGGTPNSDDRGYLSARAVIDGVTYHFQCDVDGQRPREIHRLGSTGKWRRVTFSVVPRIAREIEPAMIEHCKRKAPEEGERPTSEAVIKHEYPSRYGPGQGDKDVDEVWRILDTIKPGVISQDVRSFLAGAFTGLIKKEAKNADH